MSGGPSARKSRGLVPKLFMYAIGFTIFFLAGFFSKFYTNQSIEILLLLIAGIMGGDYFLTSEQERENLRELARSLAFVYTVSVVLMLVNANISLDSLTLPTAPIGYFGCIATYLVFVAYSLQVEYLFKVNILRTLGLVILIGVGTASLILALSGAVEFQLNLTGIWLLISAVLIGISASLISKTRLVSPPRNAGMIADTRQVISQEAQIPPPFSTTTGSLELNALPPELTLLSKLGYRCLIGQNLLEMEPQIHKLREPKPIYFKFWNDTDAKLKEQLIDDKTVYDILENISRAMNDRNKDLDKASRLMLEPPSSIHLYIQACDQYYEKLRKIGFLS